MLYKDGWSHDFTFPIEYSNGDFDFGSDEELIQTIRYVFGVNRLHIGKALVSVLSYLEDRYSLYLPSCIICSCSNYLRNQCVVQQRYFKGCSLCGGVYDALPDGKVTNNESERLLTDAEDAEKIEEVAKINFFVKFINGIVKSLKSKIGKE